MDRRFTEKFEIPELKKHQTINYDDDDSTSHKGLLDKVFDLAGLNLQKFGNFFRGESPAPRGYNEPLKSERNHNSRTHTSKPPLYFEKRQSQ